MTTRSRLIQVSEAEYVQLRNGYGWRTIIVCTVCALLTSLGVASVLLTNLLSETHERFWKRDAEWPAQLEELRKKMRDSCKEEIADLELWRVERLEGELMELGDKVRKAVIHR